MWLVATVAALIALVAMAAVPAGAATRARERTATQWSGADALRQLGTRLPEVAARHHITPARLEQRLRTEPSLAVDATDALFYTEPTAPSAPADESETLTPSLDEADTFSLHSRPGSSHVIYLDFDGETISGTQWNVSFVGGAACYTDPFNATGSAATFAQSELDIIAGVWARVSEDYAQWDVDVTTEDPGYAAINRASSADDVFGTRALITTSTTVCSNGKTFYQSACSSGCGGKAYIGVYNITGSWHDDYQPALVFHNGLSNSSKSIAEATSHEVGHNLGLFHDGSNSGCGTDGLAACGYYTGHAAWAPIMGVGYYRPVTQWSKGEYGGANNTENDLSIVQSYGMTLIADDHGDTAETATHLYAPNPEADGLIRTDTDVDMFSVDAGAGPASFTVTPSGTGPNLDVKLELRDDDDVVVASSDPPSAYVNADSASGLSASISTTLTGGRYYLVVDGVGAGNPATTGYSDYGSLGHYSLSGTVADPPPVPPDAPGAVSAVARNGAAEVSWSPDDDAGSSVVTDYTVTVYADDGSAPEGVTGSTSRSVGGDDTEFQFTGLSNGTTYLLKVAAVNSAGTSDESDGAMVTPDGTAPTSTMLQPTGTWLLTTTVPAAWSGSDSDTGVAHYDVQRRGAAYSKNFGTFSNWKTDTLATAANYGGGRGYTYCFHARSEDNAGNVSAYTADRCTAVPLAASSLTYSSGWTAKSLSGVYTGAYRTTTKSGATATRSGVTAKQLALVATKCLSCGSVKVYWNGVYKKTISLHASSTQRKQVISLLSFSGVSTGTLKLVVSTSGKQVSLEGLGVSKV